MKKQVNNFEIIHIHWALFELRLRGKKWKKVNGAFVSETDTKERNKNAKKTSFEKLCGSEKEIVERTFSDFNKKKIISALNKNLSLWRNAPNRLLLSLWQRRRLLDMKTGLGNSFSEPLLFLIKNTIKIVLLSNNFFSFILLFRSSQPFLFWTLEILNEHKSTYF